MNLVDDELSSHANSRTLAPSPIFEFLVAADLHTETKEK
jgi:hypothetical protein